MNMKVHDFLASLRSIVYDNASAIAESEIFVIGDLTCCYHQSSKKFNVFGRSLADISKATSILWDDKNVGRGGRVDVFECKDFLIFFDDCCRDLTRDNLVEYSRGSFVSEPS
jgi:hypothetical protein